MKSENKNKLLGIKEKIIIITASILFLYFLISFYFINHYYFNTVINGVNVSLKKHGGAERNIRNYINNYEMRIIERNNVTEEITGLEIGMHYSTKAEITDIINRQKPFIWIGSLFKYKKYYIDGLYSYDVNKLNSKINMLNCLNKDIIEPRNVSFQYSNGSYEVIEAVYGNKINVDKFYEAIKMSISEGKTELDLEEMQYYEKPKYTLASEKTLITKDLLNKYAATKVTYHFGSKKEILDGTIINEWLSVDENLDVVIDQRAVMKYVIELGIKYNTVGVTRKFKTSSGIIVEVKGGLYGWKINHEAESKALLEHINRNEVIEKEPIYSQKALSHEENDIGDTYVEINITKQHLWYYKAGKLVTDGPVVTGNPNKGNSTVLGTYMINYKENGSTLSGRNYDVKVTYWMPFYGNIGIHDASWRSSFGGEIYKKKGTHGCVNAPYYLAQTIYENIEEGVPVICYKE